MSPPLLPPSSSQTSSVPLKRPETTSGWTEEPKQSFESSFKGLHVQRPGQWSLHTVVEAVQSPEQLRALLALTPDGQRRLEQLFKHERRSSHEILSNLDEKLTRLRTIARLWKRSIRAGRKVSLTRWSEGEGVLLLGRSETFTRPLQAMNQAIVRRVAEVLSDKPSDRDDHSWVFLDEASAIGEQQGLEQLLQRGRQKGVHVVLGFQSMTGLRVAYPDGVADNMWSMCENHAILRVNDIDKDGKWASEQFGKFEYWEVSRSEGPSGPSETQSKRKSELILPNEFAEFPLTSPEGGLTGAFASSVVGSWRTKMSWDFVRRHMPEDSQDPSDQGLIKRSEHDQLPLDDEDVDQAPSGLRDPLP